MSDLNEFNPNRLLIARQRRGLTKKSLAELVGLSTKSITNFESGDSPPSETNVLELASKLDFPVEFFFGPDVDVPTDENASFRSFSRMTAGQKNAALAAGSIAYLFSDWVDSRFELPSPEIPDCTGMEPEIAAECVRAAWGLGQRPIQNMVHLLESKGVKVFSLSEETSQVNAFSCWRNGSIPFVFLNTMKSAESSRFDAAHELGHLVLHRHGSNKGKEVENEANAFASALLMPKESVLAFAWNCRTLADILRLKKNWNVSAMALTYRLSRVGILTEWLYRGLCIELSSLGARTSEIDPSPHETSQILQKVMGFLRDRGMSIRGIASELRIPVSDLNKILFGLTPVLVEGVVSGSRPSFSEKPSLRLVK